MQLPRTMPAAAIGARPAGSIVVGSGGGWSLGCHCLRMGIGYTYLETEGKGMTQFMTAAEQVEHGHTARGEPTYAELQAVNAEILSALEEIANCGHDYYCQGECPNEIARAAIAKAKGEIP